MLQPRDRRRRRQAFTLIELLVVIAIIAVLVGILLPVLSSIRKAGKAALCLSNLRTLGQATTMYYTDHNRYLPQPSLDGHLATALGPDAQNSAMWFNALDYYLQQSGIKSNNAADRNYVSFKQDPVWLDLPTTVNNGVAVDPDDVRTIKMNEYFGHITTSTTPAGGAPFRFFRVTDAPQPASTVLFIDGRAHDTPAENGVVDTANDGLFAARPIFVGLRHDEGANAARVDGSAAFHRNEIQVSTGANTYLGWYDDDETNENLRPDVTFNFRPDDFN